MYRKPHGQMTIDDFILPFVGKLKADNRWVKMAEIILWDEIEQEYAKLFENEIGNVAKPARMVLSALITKEKFSYSAIDTLEQLECNNYNEGLKLIESVKRYHDRTGYYPASVHADAIYRNRENLNICKAHGIRLSGLKLGLPPKIVSAKDKKLARQDDRDRILVEVAFVVIVDKYSPFWGGENSPPFIK